MSSIGVDEWGKSRAEPEAMSPLGRAGRMVRTRLGWWSRYGTFGALALLLPLIGLSVYQQQVGVNALLLALTAVGLNVAVGWAGVFDLGYVAFYGFGSYAFALLASDQLGRHGIHLNAIVALPIVVAAGVVLGLLLGLPARRVSGDYLAILTLFFGEAFNEITNNVGSKYLGGPNGISGVDPIGAFGAQITTPHGYYYLLALVLLVVMAGLHLLDRGRIGHAWQAVREDPLAARMMTVPVNRVRLIAFALGAAIAALAGAIFAASQAGVYPTSFTQPVLVLMYTALVVGGTGTLSGAVAGAIALTLVTELLRQPDYAGYVFYGVIALALLAKVRPWRRLVAMVVALAVSGAIAYAVVHAVRPAWTSGEFQSSGLLHDVLGHWLIVPPDAQIAGNWAFVLTVAFGMAAASSRGVLRDAAIVCAVYAAAFAWETRLAAEVSVTRQLLIGALLVCVMIARPQGFFGFRRTVVV